MEIEQRIYIVRGILKYLREEREKLHSTEADKYNLVYIEIIKLEGEEKALQELIDKKYKKLF